MPRKYIYKKTVPFCLIEACDRPSDYGGFCAKHYAQKYRYGGIKRTIHDRNEIRTFGNISYISLYNKDNIVIEEAIIDTDDISLVSSYKWHLSGPLKHVRNQKLGIHNVLLGCSPVDHIDGNPLNNRRVNLRAATYAENARNSVRNTNKISCSFKGVYFDDTTKKKWKAAISNKTIGRYKTQEEAAWMYDQYALGLFDEFAKTNFDYN